MNRIGRKLRTAVFAVVLISCSVGSAHAELRVLKLLEVLSASTWLQDVTSVVMAPDGSSLYIASDSHYGPVLVLLDVDVETGIPSFHEIYWLSYGEFEGFESSGAPILSEDSRFVYLPAVTRIGSPPNQRPVSVVLVLSRTSQGGLDVLGFTVLEGFGFPHLGERLNLSLSPDERFLYVSRPGFQQDEAIAVLRRNRKRGLLTLVETLEVDVELEGPLEFSPDGRYAYSLAHYFPLSTDEIVLRVFRRDRDSGSLRAIGSVSNEGFPSAARLLAIRVSRDGELLYGAASGQLFVFNRQITTGNLQLLDVFQGYFGSGDEGSLVLSPDDRHLYQCVGGGPLHAYERDPVSGLIELVELLPEADCRFLALDPGGRRVYFAGLDETEFPFRYGVGVVERDLQTDRLALKGWLHDGEGLPEYLNPFSSLAISPDGRHAYASYRGGGLMVFDRDLGENGRLRSRRSAISEPLESSAPILAFSARGDHLYAQTVEFLHVFARDSIDGSLSIVQHLNAEGRAITLSPDGRHAYLGLQAEGIVIYGRDASSGVLTEIGRWENFVPGDFWNGSIEMSPDGRNLYFSGYDSLHVFSRDLNSGLLASLQEFDVLSCPENGGFIPPSRIFPSPDGKQVYAISSIGRSIVVLGADPDSGSLHVLQCPLEEADFLRFTRDGRRAFGSSTIWDRNPESGKLTLVDRYGLPGSPGEIPVPTSDGRNVYIIGAESVEVYALRQLENIEFPDFRFVVSIERPGSDDLIGWEVSECPPETICVQGAVPGRTETLLRVVGPKPNGRLWPTLVKFSTSPVDVTIEQITTGSVRQYHLAGAAPGSEKLPGMIDRDGFGLNTEISGVRWAEAMKAGEEPPPPSNEFITSEEFSDFRFQVRLTDGAGQEIPSRKESQCFKETLCVSGAVPGRSELFLRIVGPKPNGYLWPTLVRTTTSMMEVWIEQVSTGETRYYRLDRAVRGSTDLTGIFDREGFLP